MPFLLVCLVGLLVSVDVSPASSPVLSGQVRLSDGLPVVGAQVVLFDVADLRRGPVGQATTDETGQFALPLATGGTLALPSEVGLGQNSYTFVGDTSTIGNSGSPVYTVPDSTGNVHIVGILTGSFYRGGERVTSFSSWNDVTQGLSLKSVGE